MFLQTTPCGVITEGRAVGVGTVPMDIADRRAIAAEYGAAGRGEVAGRVVAVAEGCVEGICAEGDGLVAVCADFLGCARGWGGGFWGGEVVFVLGDVETEEYLFPLRW